ncbi:MAG: VgrG-related protein [Actinomycetota bacterium]
MTEYSAKPLVEVDGSAVETEVDLRLERAVVDDHALLPDMFELQFRDPHKDVFERARIRIGSTVRLLAGRQGEEATELLVNGEVTGLEADFDASGTHAVVRGYDASHRLHRGRRTETYRNVTDADVVRAVAARAGLQLGRVDETPTVHRHVSQANVTDWELLTSRAREIGYELSVEDGRLEYRKPAEATEAPEPGDLNSTNVHQLVLGSNLDAFRPRLSSAEQVNEVQVRGWDPEKKQAVVGRAPVGSSGASLAAVPADLAAAFGGPTYVSADRPFSQQSEVDDAARAIADQIGSSFAEAEGTAHGNPRLKAGSAISVGLTGRSFDGLYAITACRHVFDRNGYKTHFVVTGRHDQSLLGLATASKPGRGEGAPPLAGVVVAQVTSISDPDEQARVKLSFPWLADTYETDWVRLVQPGAGDRRGMVVVPEVNDEVIVAFEHGDIRRPYVLGGLYNGVDKPWLGDGFVDSGTGEARRRGFVSKRGHSIVFFDADDDDGLALLTGDRSLRISLNKSSTTVKVSSSGKVTIEAADEVSVTGNKIELAAKSGVSIDGGAGDVVVKGTQIKLN